ncbi:substrate-binding domain-containing protein [Streptomyces mexicanus]|jgi:ribose transport system substrate-binding protein|uniref:Substrate-binding domain-containing protein n=1 Tax=Streptomyces mexicanus TaxID=178566 RepID=A0A7X1LQB0_9ACTN|nr:substrate-binding domain-containing protein [Streptomyces mexicanus]
MDKRGLGGMDRRRLLLSGAVLGGGALVAGCTSNKSDASTDDVKAASTSGTDNDKPGKHVTIGFSAPAADHGWMAAITKNAMAQAKQFSDVHLEAVEGTNDVNAQISQVQTLIGKKVDVLVILPFDGKALTSVAQQAMDAGIPVINVDRVFDTPLAYRTWIGGDNFGMGLNAGLYIGRTLKAKGVSAPVIGEIAGIDNLELTKQRSAGFQKGLAKYGYRVGIRQAANFTADSGQQVMSNVLQARSHLDAVWNHDDDQGIGVEAAIKQAGRDEFFMVGGAGSRHAMQEIKADNSVLKATVVYPSNMSASAVKIARLIAQGKGMNDLVGADLPSSVTLFSATVTKENVDQYLPGAFS